MLRVKSRGVGSIGKGGAEKFNILGRGAREGDIK